MINGWCRYATRRVGDTPTGRPAHGGMRTARKTRPQIGRMARMGMNLVDAMIVGRLAGSALKWAKLLQLRELVVRWGGR